MPTNPTPLTRPTPTSRKAKGADRLTRALVNVWPTELPARLAATAAESATATTTATFASSATTASAAATESATARYLRPRFIHRNAASVDFSVVELFDRRRSAFVGLHLHEAETTRAAGGHVAHDAYGGHGPGLREEILERPLLGIEGQISDEQLPIHTPSQT
jgi:hypothetical protein